MIDYLGAIRAESTRFHNLISSTPPTAPVPSCPGWTVADLTWHLAEVQHFWAIIVRDLLAEPATMAEPDRPGDDSLPALFLEWSAELVSALEARSPDDACWSWHRGGETVGWVLRRQAHEALIHRVDAELAAGTDFAMDPVLAADGVDETLTVMLDATGLPEWSEFTPNGSTAVLAIDGGTSWGMDLGRFTGTSPNTGKTYDEPSLMLIGSVADPSATLRGASVDLNLWLWGRGPVDPIAIEGDPAIADFIRAAAVAATQ